MTDISKQNEKRMRLMSTLDITPDFEAASLELSEHPKKEEILNTFEELYVKQLTPPLDVIKQLRSKYGVSSLLVSSLLEEANLALNQTMDLKARFSQTLDVIDRQISELIKVQGEDSGYEDSGVATIDIINTMTPLLKQKTTLLQEGLKLNIFENQLKKEQEEKTKKKSLAELEAEYKEKFGDEHGV